MNSLSVLPVITKPTRIAGDSCSLIDNVFISNLLNFQTDILTVDITDHFPVFSMCENYLFNNKSRNPTKRTHRIFHDRTLGNLFDRFATHNFGIIIENETVDNSIRILHNTLLEDFNLCCPLKSKYVSYKDLGNLELTILSKF